nr:hypothetical protein 30 [bacterium]
MIKFEGATIDEHHFTNAYYVYLIDEKHNPTGFSFEELLDDVRSHTMSENRRNSKDIYLSLEGLLRSCYIMVCARGIKIDPICYPYASEETKSFNRRWSKVRREFIEYFKQQYLANKDSITLKTVDSMSRASSAA